MHPRVYAFSIRMDLKRQRFAHKVNSKLKKVSCAADGDVQP